MWCGTRICSWTGVAFLPTLKPTCPGQPWPRPQSQSPAQPASCLCLELAGGLSSWGSEVASPSLGVSHTEPSPLPPHPSPGLQPQENRLAPSVDPSLLCLGISYTLQLSFPGAGAKQTPPQRLARLQTFCVEPFSAAVGRRTSSGLEETQQLASVYCAPDVRQCIFSTSKSTQKTCCSE